MKKSQNDNSDLKWAIILAIALSMGITWLITLSAVIGYLATHAH